MTIFDQVSKDIAEAMKARNKVRLEALRNLKKLLLEAKTAAGANDTVTDDTALKIVQKLVKQGRDSAQVFLDNGRQELADAELAQVVELEGYLPRQLTQEQVSAALTAIIAEVGATSQKDMGKVMGLACARLAGQADGKVIAATVRALLN